MRDFAVSGDPRVQAQLDRLARLSLPKGRLSLRPIRRLLAALGDPQHLLPPVFHIAGTNGKGSTSAFLRVMLEAGGNRVHQFTSPHLVRYNERIRIAGQLIDDGELAALLKEVLDAAGDDIGASFFEVTTAVAFLAFARTPADAAIIEVGLGGRFDATNVLEKPACCAIASLALDHEAFLLAPEEGAPQMPLARIAFEKAGIVRPGVPLVTQSYPPEAQAEIERAARIAGAPLHMRGQDWSASAGTLLEYSDRHGALALPLPTLTGAFQADNAALAVAMLRHQDYVSVPDAALAQGIRAAHWPARLQSLGPGPLAALAPGFKLIVDGGHNPQAAGVLRDYLTGLDGPVHAIIGMLANKNAEGFVTAIAPHLASLTAVPLAGHDHHKPGFLAGLAPAIPTRTAPDLAAALRAVAAASTPSNVLVCGSLYLAGEALRDNREFPD